MTQCILGIFCHFVDTCVFGTFCVFHGFLVTETRSPCFLRLLPKPPPRAPRACRHGCSCARGTRPRATTRSGPRRRSPSAEVATRVDQNRGASQEDSVILAPEVFASLFHGALATASAFSWRRIFKNKFMQPPWSSSLEQTSKTWVTEDLEDLA